MTTAVLYDAPGPRTRRRNLLGGIAGALVLAVLAGLVIARLAATDQFEADKWTVFTDPDILRFFLEGLLGTLLAAAAAIVLAMLFGAALAAGRLSDHAALRLPATWTVELFRAIPLLLLIFFLFFQFGDVLGAFGAVVLSLMLYNGSVLAEVFRAGINAVPRGQSEAAYALGLSKSQVMRIVLMPQAVRTMLPAIVSQCVVALKDTALGSVIAYEELVRKGQLTYNSYHNILPVAIVLAAIFIVINYALSRVAVWLERRQSRQYGRQQVMAAEQAIGAEAV